MDFQWMEHIGWLRKAKNLLAVRNRLGDLLCLAPRFGIAPRPPSGREPGISALMRVKNEAQWIEIAIRSLAPFVEQFSIVDNGSTDGTPEIIRRVARELDLRYVLEILPTEDFGEVCDRALANTTCTWVLRWDGDMIARTGGKESFAGIRDFALSLDPRMYYSLYFPHIRLEGDLFHQDPSQLIHYEDWLFTFSPKLHHVRTGKYRELRYPLYYKRIYCWETGSFHLGGIDSPEAMALRRYWVDWRERNDFVRWPTLRSYALERIREEYRTDSLVEAGALIIRERSHDYVLYDCKRFGDYPSLLRPYLENFPIRLVRRDGKVAGRSDIMDVLDRLDAERMKSAVDVIIPTRGREEHALATAEALLRQDFPRFRVLVIDQSDIPSERLRLLSSRDPRLVYHVSESRGLPAGRNAGIGLSVADIVVFVDDDVIPEPGFIEGHVRAFGDGRTGAVAGMIHERDLPDEGISPERMGSVNPWTGALLRGYTALQPREVDTAPGGNMSFRGSVLMEIGGFDTRYGGAFLFEETDASLAVRARGYHIRYTPDAPLTHLRVSNGGCRLPGMDREAYWYAHNFMLLFRKHFPWYTFPSWFFIRSAKLFRDSVSAGSLVPLAAGLRGFRDGWRAFRKERSGEGVHAASWSRKDGIESRS